MVSALRKMGNSTGIIVPKGVLREAGLAVGARLNFVVENGGIMLRPVEEVRAGWAEDAARIGAEPLTADERDWLDFPNAGDADGSW